MSPWTLSLQLRRRDLDYLGHVTAVVHSELLGEARMEWMCLICGHDSPAYVQVVENLTFFREIRFADGPVTVDIEVLEVGNSSITLSETLRGNDGEVRTRSSATIVSWDPEGRRSRPLTDRERSVIASLLSPADAT
jgi:acyl-CoA thioesterase FadM